VRRFLVLLAITATVWVLVAQVRRGFELPTRHGEGMAQFLGLPANPVALYTFGPDPTLVPGARWFWVGRNLLRWSGDLTKSVWLPTYVTVNDATHITFTAQYGRIRQSVVTTAGQYYTLFFTARRVSGNARLWFLHDDSASGNTTPVTLSDTLTDYATTVLGRTDGGFVDFGIDDMNSSGWGQIEVTRWMVIPGSHTAAECAALYQKTEAQQTFHDWSGNGHTASRGSDDEAEDTNDPELTPSSRNLLAPGSTEDLTEWSTGGTPIVTATTVEDDDASGYEQINQNVTVPDGAQLTRTIWVQKDSVAPTTRFPGFQNNFGASYYVVHLDTSTGAAKEREGGLEGSYSVTDAGDAWKVVMTFTAGGTTASIRIYPAIGANADLQAESPAAIGEVTILKQQLEIGSTATAYTNPAEESLVQGATFDGTDDYVVLPDESALKPDAFTVIAVLRMHDATDGEPVISWSATDSRPAVYARSPDDWGNQSKPLIYLNSENYCYFAETIETEAWHVLAVTVPGSGQTDIEEAAFYLDGTALTVDTVYSADSQMSKGQPWLGRAGDYYGHMDQALVAVYSRVLSAAETQRSYRSIARLYWDWRGICVSGWESHCQSPPLHAKLLAPWQPDGTWALAMLPRKLGLVPVWREVQ